MSTPQITTRRATTPPLLIRSTNLGACSISVSMIPLEPDTENVEHHREMLDGRADREEQPPALEAADRGDVGRAEGHEGEDQEPDRDPLHPARRALEEVDDAHQP